MNSPQYNTKINVTVYDGWIYEGETRKRTMKTIEIEALVAWKGIAVHGQLNRDHVPSKSDFKITHLKSGLAFNEYGYGKMEMLRAFEVLTWIDYDFEVEESKLKEDQSMIKCLVSKARGLKNKRQVSDAIARCNEIIKTWND